jgi:hypothetical protein
MPGQADTQPPGWGIWDVGVAIIAFMALWLVLAVLAQALMFVLVAAGLIFTIGSLTD